MKINWSAFVYNPAYQIGAVVAILLTVGIVMASQDSCGKGHEQTATVEHTKADASAERLKDALQEIDGLHRKVADLEAAGRAWKSRYEEALKRIPKQPDLVPADHGVLTSSLETAGFKKGVQIQSGAVAAIFPPEDAGLAYLLSKRAERADALEEALKACDELEKSQAGIIEAQKAENEKQREAIRVSMEESLHRQQEALALGAALKVEKQKGWQKYALGVAGVVVGAYATRR